MALRFRVCTRYTRIETPSAKESVSVTAIVPIVHNGIELGTGRTGIGMLLAREYFSVTGIVLVLPYDTKCVSVEPELHLCHTNPCFNVGTTGVTSTLLFRCYKVHRASGVARDGAHGRKT